MAEERYDRGLEKLKEIEGGAGETIIQNIENISPDLGKYVVEYAFGDIYSRGGLTLKQKEIVAVSILVAMGNAVPQLKARLNSALRAGCSLDEVNEIILQMSAYAGFPTAINAMKVLKEVLTEIEDVGRGHNRTKRELKQSPTNMYETVAEWLSKLDPNISRILEYEFEEMMPDIARCTIEYGYGNAYSRSGIDLKSRQIATIAAISALGKTPDLLRFHINCGLNIGLTEQEVMEIMILVSVYAGFPVALNGSFTAKEVFQSRAGLK